LGVTIAAPLLIVLLQRINIVVPNIRAGGTNSFPLPFLLALLPSLVWPVLLERSKFAIDTVSLRGTRVALLDFTSTALPAIAGGISLLVFGDPVLQAAGRNEILFTFVGLFSMSIFYSYASFLVGIIYFIAAALAGFGYEQKIPPGWAFVLGPWAVGPGTAQLVFAFVVSSLFFLGSRVRK
jgi:hypothetical protein